MRIFGIIVLGILGIAALIASSVFFLLGLHLPEYRYGYRIVVEVESGGSIKSGAGVIQVKVNEQTQNFIPLPPYVSRAYGEAVFVELNGGRNLVALLATGPSGSNVNYPIYIGPKVFGFNGLSRDILQQITHLRGVRDLAVSDYPTFITFDDLNNPGSARLVLPSDLEREFGSGTRLARVRVEMTSDPVSRTIGTKLPWWAQPGRPAEQAWRALLAGQTVGSSIEPETLFERK